MTDILKFLEAAKNIRGVMASGSLAGISAYGGGYVKDFMPPHNGYAAWACTIGFCLSVLLLALIAIRATFSKAPVETA